MSEEQCVKLRQFFFSWLFLLSWVGCSSSNDPHATKSSVLLGDFTDWRGMTKETHTMLCISLACWSWRWYLQYSFSSRLSLQSSIARERFSIQGAI
jgi:hypothetical protein